VNPAEARDGLSESSHRHLLLIGGQRCGTTWLQRVLGSHPDVRLPLIVRPEPKFLLVDDDHTNYDALFPPTGGSLLVDKSTSYLEHADAARRALRCVPDAAVIAVVRDPVERAHSNWRFSVSNGIEALSFAQSLRDDSQSRDGDGFSTSPFQSLRRGMYAELLAPWSDAFGSRLVVMQYERMTAPDGGIYIRERLGALGVAAPTRWPVLPAVANASPTDSPLDDASREMLVEYYSEASSMLREYGVDTSLWTG